VEGRKRACVQNLHGYSPDSTIVKLGKK